MQDSPDQIILEIQQENKKLKENLKQKDEVIEKKDKELERKDRKIERKNVELEKKDRKIERKDRIIRSYAYSPKITETFRSNIITKNEKCKTPLIKPCSNYSKKTRNSKKI